MIKLEKFARDPQYALWRERAATIVPALVAFVLCLHVLTRGDALFGYTGYDDGVYFAAAIQLIHGVLPYRDYTFVQPPGIALLMSPIAALGQLIGSRDALALTRVITCLVAVFNVVLVGWLVRYRGALAMFVAGISLACFPLAVTAYQTLLLEPYVACLCLGGAILVFRNGHLSELRRIFFGGVLFGFGVTVKLWAIFLIIAVVLALVPLWKRAVLPLIAGVLAGIVVPCAVFFLASPGSFWTDIVTAQLDRQAPSVGYSVGQRLLSLSGLRGLPTINATSALATLVVVAVCLVVAAIYIKTWRSCFRIDWFLLVSAPLVMVSMLVPTDFYDHYAYFPVAFFAPLLGICAARVGAPISGWFARLRIGEKKMWWRPVGVASLVAALAVGIFALSQDVSYANSYLASTVQLSPTGAIIDPANIIDAEVPSGACTLFDQAIVGIISNRYSAGQSGCPDLVDAFGTWLTGDNGQPPPQYPPYPTAFVAQWQAWLAQAHYVVLGAPGSDFVPFSPALTTWFNRHFALLVSEPEATVYVAR